MKKIACSMLLLLCPMIAFAQAASAAPAAAAAPKKNTISTYRVFVKDGHTDAFKAGLAAHAQKFHTGNWKWRVSEVLSGPDGGAYQIVEGPNSWTDEEMRGDLGADHMKDYATNITPHVEKSTPNMYLTYMEGASSTAAANWSNKSTITHYYTKPGRGGDMAALLRTYKPVYEKLGSNIVVWSTNFSGEPQFVVVRRLKDGFKDFDVDGPSLRAAYDGVHGVGAFDRAQDEVARNVSHIVGESIESKPELSSK